MVSLLYIILFETCAADFTTRFAAKLHVLWGFVDPVQPQPKYLYHLSPPRAGLQSLKYLHRVARRRDAPSKAPFLMIRADKVCSDIDVLVSNPAQACLEFCAVSSRNTCLHAAIYSVTGCSILPRRLRRRTKRLVATRRMTGGVGYSYAPFQQLS